MTYSDDLRWRIVSLIHIYNIDLDYTSTLFGPDKTIIQRWYCLFLNPGYWEEVVKDNGDHDVFLVSCNAFKLT